MNGYTIHLETMQAKCGKVLGCKYWDEIDELKKEIKKMANCILEETQGDYSGDNYEKFKERFPLAHSLSTPEKS